MGIVINNLVTCNIEIDIEKNRDDEGAISLQLETSIEDTNWHHHQ
jgi:hypothetical protein